MDASNSTSFDPVEFVMFGLTVRPGVIDPEGWLLIIEKVIRAMKPQLNYLDGFKRIEKPLDIWEDHPWMRDAEFARRPPRRLQACRITRRTRTSLSWPTPHLYATLLLDRDGKWFEAGYTRYQEDPQAYCRRLSDIELQALLSEDKRAPGWLGNKMLAGLVEMLRKSIEERERRLASMRQLHQHIVDVSSRID